MQDVDQMMVNELRRLERAVASRAKMLEAKIGKGVQVVPRRYVVSVPLGLETDPEQLAPVTRSFVVDRTSKRFICDAMVASTIARGDLKTLDAECSLPYWPGYISSGGGFASSLLSYEWQVRDTFTDRSWSSDFLPGLMLSSKVTPLEFSSAAKLPPGTEVSITVKPLYTPEGVAAIEIENITSWTLLVSFIGMEVN